MASIFNKYGQYFLKPFPSTEGISAYRLPGIFVHLPLFLISLYIGLYLCTDLAIYAHWYPLPAP